MITTSYADVDGTRVTLHTDVSFFAYSQRVPVTKKCHGPSFFAPSFTRLWSVPYHASACKTPGNHYAPPSIAVSPNRPRRSCAFCPDIPGRAFIIHNIHLTLRDRRRRRRRHRFSFINKPEPISQIIIIIIIQSDAKLYAQTYFIRYSTPHAVFKYYYRYYRHRRRRRLHDPWRNPKTIVPRVYRYEFVIVLHLNSSRHVTAIRPDSRHRKLAHKTCA